MSNIKLGNGDEVLERIERERISNPDRNKTHTILVEPSYAGDIDFKTVESGVEENIDFILHTRLENPEQE